MRRYGEKDKVMGTALVVDDSSANRLLLHRLLETDYRVIQADDGAKGVELFIQEQPDLVLMDIMMPVMDGFEATRRIKALSGRRFVPVICVTAMDDEDLLTHCIEAGADDILVRPFNANKLKAKLLAMTRIRDLYHEVSNLHSLMRREEEIAEQVFSRAVLSGNVGLDQIRSLLRPASTFSGDVLLTAFRPNGDLNILLGDFTGHGLTAAIGGLPLSETFRAMTAKGYNGREILAQINSKLYHMLPTGMFMAACMVSLSADLSSASIWNMGMPDVLILDIEHQRIRKRVASAYLPLGITASIDTDASFELLEVTSADRILLTSDGLLEAQNPQGERYGDVRLADAIQAGIACDRVFDEIILALDRFCGGSEQEDDISLVEIPCHSLVTPNSLLPQREVGLRETLQDDAVVEDSWQWSIELCGATLRRVDPVPLALSQFQELAAATEQVQNLFTILTELYVNALDHGVLGLDSALKASAAGFAQYFEERERQLETLQHGYVGIWLRHQRAGQDNRLWIRIQDSGSGFDYETWLHKTPATSVGLHGRGIQLVNGLCESLQYYEGGSLVEAVYAWQQH